MAGENIDLSSDLGQDTPLRPKTTVRSFLGVHFACCQVYSRIYVNQTYTAFEGRCPRCGGPLKIEIGPDGTDARFFTAG